MTSIESKPTIYVVGASGRSAAESVREVGFRAVVLDMYADRDTGAVAEVILVDNYPSSIVTQLKSLQPGWVLLAGGMENHSEIVAELSRFHRVLGPSAEQIEFFRKFETLENSIRESSHSNLLGFPRIARSPEDIDEIGRWLLKSRLGCGGFHIQRLPSIEQAMSLAEDLYIQREVFGQSVGTVFLCEPNHVKLLGATASITKEMHESLVGEQPELPLMAYRGSYGPICVPSDLEDAMCIWMQSLTHVANYSGILQADWVIGNNKGWLLEINPRWTAGMEIIEWATGRNLFSMQASLDKELMLLACEPTFSSPRDSTSSRLFKAIQYAALPILVGQEQSDEMMQHKFNRFHKPARLGTSVAGWGDIPEPGVEISAGHPIASRFSVI
jgi:predicted ATP-grasp superfamily ATP-dependent carboligase